MNIGNITSNNFNLDNNGKDIQIEVYEQLIEQLQQENQELKLELSGYRQAILEDKDMLGLKEENTELKKQLEEKENIACNWKDNCLENAGKIEKLENQQKEFIKFLEDNYKETKDIWYIKILQKYKSIIGVSDEEEN